HPKTTGARSIGAAARPVTGTTAVVTDRGHPDALRQLLIEDRIRESVQGADPDRARLRRIQLGVLLDASQCRGQLGSEMVPQARLQPFVPCGRIARLLGRAGMERDGLHGFGPSRLLRTSSAG